jgi:hypothetical protein
VGFTVTWIGTGSRFRGDRKQLGDGWSVETLFALVKRADDQDPLRGELDPEGQPSPQAQTI